MKTKPIHRFIRCVWTAVLLTAASTAWAQTLTNGLIFYAPFTGSLNDIAGGRTGNILAPPTLHASGGVGGGAYVQLQNDPTTPEQVVFYDDPTPASNSFSFQIWVRTADASSAQNGQTESDMAIAANKDWGAGGNVGWVLAREDGAADGDKFQWNMNTANGSRKDLDLRNSSAIVFDGNWHQLLVTYERAGSAIFYRDGLPIATVNISANAGSMRPALGTWVTNNILALGQDASLRYWHATDPTQVSSLNGDLDEAAMWSRVLSAEEVYAAYAKGMAGLSLTGNLTPYFVQQPQGGTRYSSDTFRLSCLPADDRGPLTYQWYQGSSPVSGATSRVSLVNNLTVGTATYTVVVNDGVGSITSAPAVLTVLSAAKITNAITAYLNFDNNILGQAGTTFNGTPLGADPNPKYTAGAIGTAVTFNNDASASGIPTDWAVSLGDLETTYSNNWAFSLWVNLTNNLDGGLLGNKDWSAGGNIGWVFAPYNTVELNYYAAGGPRRDIGTVNVRNGLWHHVACVFNRDANLTYVYVDGNLTTSASLSMTGWESLTPSSFSPNDTLVGSSGNGPYSGAGSVDDLGIWSRTLTGDEILAIYAQGMSGQPLTTAVAGTAVKPSISAQPQGLTVYEGGRVALSVSAVGTTPLAFQWFRNGGAVADATNSALAYYPAAPTQSGDYTVVVTNRFGAVTSSPPAVVNVLPIASVTSGLAVYLNLDNNLNGSAGTTNNGTPLYGDYTAKYTPGKIGSAAIFNNDGSGGTASDWSISLGNIEWLYASSWTFSLWVNATNANDGALIGNKDWDSGGNIGWVFCPTRVGNGFGARGFLNYTCAGGPRMDPGGANLMNAWHHVVGVFNRDVNLVSIYVDGSFLMSTNLANTGTESLTPTAFVNDTLIGASGPGTWSGQGIVDDVGLWVRPLSAQEILAIYVQGLYGQPLTTAVAGSIAPFITAQPQNATRPEGLPVSFAVSATGTPPLNYQWRRNGVNLLGATDSTVSFPAAMFDNGAAYTVVVGNSYGSTTSSPPAVLTVLPAAASITSGLQVYLNLDSNILAQAGTTHNGTVIGAVGLEKYAPGVIGAAAQFNNDNSDSAIVSDWAISLGDIESLYASSFSFSLWVKTLDTYGALLGNKNWYAGGNIGWCISEYYTDWLNYRAVDSARHDIGNFNWADNQWHHVAAVFYREGNRVFTYVDGKLTAQASLSNTGLESLTPIEISTTLVGSSGSSQESAYGSVDDLAMWNLPLGQAQIVGIYQAGLKGKGVPQATAGAPSLVAVPSGGNLVLAYPDWAYGYTLQTSSTMASGSWTTVSAARSVVNGQTIVTLPVAAGPAFFRLVH